MIGCFAAEQWVHHTQCGARRPGEKGEAGWEEARSPDGGVLLGPAQVGPLALLSQAPAHTGLHVVCFSEKPAESVTPTLPFRV